MVTKPRATKTLKDTAKSLMLLLTLLLGVALAFWMSRKTGVENFWWERPSVEVFDSDSAVKRISKSSNRTERAGDRELTKSEAPTDLRQAMQLVDEGRWNEAEILLEKLLQAEPKNEAALIELAMLKILERNDRKAGQELLERAVRVNPSNESAVIELVSLYEENRGWEEAYTFFQSLPDGSSSVVEYARGSALLALGRSEEAVEHLQKAVYDGDFREFDARRNLADALAAAGRYEESMRESEQIIQGPYRPAEQRLARMQLAHTLMDTKRFTEARRILQTMLDGEPSDKWVGAMLQQVNDAESVR